jgi:parallel beta-helix repeat protein
LYLINNSKRNGGSQIIYVREGIYNENIFVNKTVSLIGENRNNTIIKSRKNGNCITIRSNNTIIENFTIDGQVSNAFSGNNNGIFISPNCWGNQIKENVIKNNSGYGILISDSCRNLIKNNIIKRNVNGIKIVKESDDLFVKEIVLTCGNIIVHNSIESNLNYGIYLEGILNNKIEKNNFISNGENAKFYLSRGNLWNNNYWDDEDSKDFKRICGIWGPIFPHRRVVHHGEFLIEKIFNFFIFPDVKYIGIVNIGVPNNLIPDIFYSILGKLRISYNLAIDHNPAQEPYRIT